jgi:hypothetical protein
VAWALVAGGLLVAALVVVALAVVRRSHAPAVTRARAGSGVVLGHVAFEITGVRTVARARSATTSVAVGVEYENVGETPVTAFTSDSGFLGGDGKTYDLTSGGAAISDLQRHASGRATFVFAVGRAAVRGGRFLLTDCAAPLLDVTDQRCQVAIVDLGLR